MPNVNTVSFGPGLGNADLQAQQLQLQRQQQMADMIRQQSVTPQETQMVSGRAVKNSPWLGVTQIAKALLANKMQSTNDAKQVELGNVASERWGAAIRAAMGSGVSDQPAASGAAPGAPQPAPSAAPPPLTSTPQASMPSGPLAAAPGPLSSDPQSSQPPTPMQAPQQQSQEPAPAPAPGPSTAPTQAAPRGSHFTPQRYAQVLSAYNVSPELGNKLLENLLTPTNEQKNNEALGIGTPEARALEIGERTKKGYIAPTRLGEGAYADAQGVVQGLPTSAPPGFINIKGADGAWSTEKVKGGVDAVAASQAAVLRGKNSQTLAPPDQQVTNPDGTRQPATIASTIDGIGQPPNQGFPPGTALPAPTPGTQSRSEILNQELSKIQARPDSPQKASDLAAIQREIGGAGKVGSMPGIPRGVGAPFGQQQGAELAQTEMSKKWMAQSDANQQAQTTSSYLQNIRGLSERAATGPLSDKLAFANGLLSLVGNERAKDAVTANNLMDKYSNQITARLGAGGLSTDAGRAIISAAYPNSKMSVGAIHDAVDNLVGANEMTKARTLVLAPHANNRDPAAYNQREVAFDQAADPRIWQWKNIKDPVQRRAFAATVMKQDPSFPKRIDALEQIGALK